MTPYNQLFRLTLSINAVALGTTTAVAQKQLKRLPPARVTINEDILAAFVDEPCHHFEVARDRFVSGDSKQVADHLHTVVALLRLEAVCATLDGNAALETSIAELEWLASDAENRRVDTVRVLEEAFARAIRNGRPPLHREGSSLLSARDISR